MNPTLTIEEGSGHHKDVAVWGKPGLAKKESTDMTMSLGRMAMEH